MGLDSATTCLEPKWRQTEDYLTRKPDIVRRSSQLEAEVSRWHWKDTCYSSLSASLLALLPLALPTRCKPPRYSQGIRTFRSEISRALRWLGIAQANGWQVYCRQLISPFFTQHLRIYHLQWEEALVLRLVTLGESATFNFITGDWATPVIALADPISTKVGLTCGVVKAIVD